MGMQLTGAFLRKTFAPWPWSITAKHETNGPFVCTGDQTQGPHVFTLYLWIMIPPNLLFSSNKSLLQAESPSHHLQTSDTLVFPFLFSIAFKAIQQPTCKLNSHVCVYLGNGHEGLPAISDEDWCWPRPRVSLGLSIANESSGGVAWEEET